MTDFGHDLLFGAFLTPEAGPAEQVVGLDLVVFQDHPYQAGFWERGRRWEWGWGCGQPGARHFRVGYAPPPGA